MEVIHILLLHDRGSVLKEALLGDHADYSNELSAFEVNVPPIDRIVTKKTTHDNGS